MKGTDTAGEANICDQGVLHHILDELRSEVQDLECVFRQACCAECRCNSFCSELRQLSKVGSH